MDVRGYVQRGFQRGRIAQLNPRNPESIGWAMQASGGSADATVSWPLANLAFYIPIYIYSPITIVAASWQNGTGAGGNIDIGLYDSAGTRLTSTGTVGRGTASTQVTSTALTDYTVAVSGLYYLAMSHDGTSNIFGSAVTAGVCEAMGVCEQTSAFVLPSTATMTRTTRAYIPAFSLLCQTTSMPLP